MKSLNEEFRITSAQVGYMLRWLEFQQQNKGFVGVAEDVVEEYLYDINAVRKKRELIYKRKQKLDELKAQAANPAVKDVTSKTVRASVGEMAVLMMEIGVVWDAFQRGMGQFPPMPTAKGKKARESEELLEFDYEKNLEKYA